MRAVVGAWLPFILLGGYGLALVVTLPDYGVTWDEVGWFSYGYAQWQWLLGRTTTLTDPSDYFHYGSLASLLAAGSHYLFHEMLGWFTSDVAYHLVNVSFALLLALGIVVWGRQALGNTGAFLALAIWMLLPRLWPEAHNNISDLPGAAASFWAAWASWRVVEEPNIRSFDYLLCGLMFGLAYSLRAPNVYFLALAIVLWIAVCRFWLKSDLPAFSWRAIGGMVAMFFLTVKIANPHLWTGSVFSQVLWHNPMAYLYSGIGKADLWFMGQYFPSDQVPRYYSPWLWLITTPLLVLVCFSCAVTQLIRSGRRAAATSMLFLILWATFLFKHVLGSGNYDGIRHFLESYAPMSLLAAAAFLQLVDWLQESPPPLRWIVYGVAVVAAVLPIVRAWRIHPYQSGYFNVLAGPLPEAWRDYEVEYWGQSFLRTTNWLGNNITPAVPIYVPDAPHIARYYLPNYVIRTLAPYWDFADRGAFQSAFDEWLRNIPAGGVLLKLSRPRIYSEKLAFTCPEGWATLFAERPEPELPALSVVCRKA